MLCATKVKGGLLSVVDLEISQGSIRVHNIVLFTTNATGQGPFSFEDIDGNVILTLMAPIEINLEIEATWIANNGLVVKSAGANTFCTVFYSQDGV